MWCTAIPLTIPRASRCTRTNLYFRVWRFPQRLRGHQWLRRVSGQLGLMYFVTLSPLSGKLARLEMTPIQIKRFRLNRPSVADIRWLQSTLDRESRKLGAAV